MAVELKELTAEIEVVLIKENLLTLRDEALLFYRLLHDGKTVSEGLAIFEV